MTTYRFKVNNLGSRLSQEFQEKRFIDAIKNIAICVYKKSYILYTDIQTAVVKICHSLFTYVDSTPKVNSMISGFQKDSIKLAKGSGNFSYSLDILSHFNLPQSLKTELIEINHKANAVKHKANTNFTLNDNEINNTYNTFKQLMYFLDGFSQTKTFSAIINLIDQQISSYKNQNKPKVKVITKNVQVNVPVDNYNQKMLKDKQELDKLNVKYKNGGLIKKAQLNKLINNNKNVQISRRKTKYLEDQNTIEMRFENYKKSIKHNDDLSFLKKHKLISEAKEKKDKQLEQLKKQYEKDIKEIKDK